MKKTRLELCVLIAAAMCIALKMLSFGSECDSVRAKVLRLHVIANSDALCDQSVKLAVRDRLLECSEDIFVGCTDLDDALSAAESMLPELEEAAADELRRNGCGYGVKVCLCRDRFPTRVYSSDESGSGTYTLPAGVYNALRVELGEARGHNWWCVMFPMLCVPSSGGCGAEDVLSPDEMNVVSCDGYDVRFACVEWYEKLRGRIK